MTTPHALIVDDEADIRELIELTLSSLGIGAHQAETLAEARDLLERHTFNFCITDMRLPDGNGLELIEHIQQHYPELPVAMITAHGNIDSAVEALKLGAFDFVQKPVELTALRNLANAALRLSSGEQRRSDPATRTLIGRSRAMERVRALIRKLGRSQAPVLISGESGTGKELVARAIHAAGPRAEQPFVPVNCGAIPEHLLESEFFGHRKGSFTSANRDKPGLFQAANGGTLFLDEVSELPLPMQVKLLRAIQERAVRPIGEPQEIPIDVRILSATNRDLAQMVHENRFRQDLFYRLNVIELPIPPLRERPEDIETIARAVLKRLSEEQGIPVPQPSPEALAALRDYPFPGNIRELENILERACALSENDTIQAGDLYLPDNPVLPAARPAQPAAQSAAQPAPAATPQAAEQDDEDDLSGSLPDPNLDGLEAYLEELERNAIMKALEATRYNKTAAAEKLGISFRALRYRLKKLNID